MSSKENMPPVQARKSKIPVPHIQHNKPVRKGIKRAVSPNACKSDPKRSPSTSKKSSAKDYGRSETRNAGSVQRKTLGELPCEQRKIVKVRRMGNENSSTKCKGVNIQPKIKKGNKCTTSSVRDFLGAEFGALPDQSGIEFEKDDSALQSILDETGIQYKEPQPGNQHAASKFTRHTLAAVPKPQRQSAAPSRVKACVEDFRKVCDDFINRTASKQPDPKRQCREAGFRNEDNFNMKLTPSKTDFCTKYGVEKSVTFQGVTPGLTSRQSLPGRTRVRPPDPFVVPGRCSMAAQTPRRLAKVGEEEEPAGTLGRTSLAPQTPLRILKKVKNVDDGLQSQKETGSANRCSLQHQTPGRVSLLGQTPGRISLSAQTPGRMSLSAQTPGRVSLYAPTSDRTSLAPQTPARVSLCDNIGNVPSVQNARLFSLTAQPPGRVSLSAQKPTQQAQNNFVLSNQGRLSLAAQTPGRVSLSAGQNPVSKRVSIIEQTPGRVKKPNQSTEHGTDRINTQVDDQNICENLARKFAMQSPENKENKIDKEKQSENMLFSGGKESQTDTPQKMLKSRTPTKEKAVPMIATPLRVKLLQTDEHTPKSTPQRVLKSVPAQQHTPRRVKILGTNSPSHTPRHGTPQEPMRVPKVVTTPGTPSRVLIRETMSPASVPRPCSDTTKQETPNKKTANKSRLAEGVDLRTIWKTKKTPSKSPILKEVLTKEPSNEVCTPRNVGEVLPTTVVSTIKRKKTLTWADALESCQSPGTKTLETKDERWESLQVKTQIFHDVMQDNPHQEKTRPSPDKDTHVTTLTNTQNSLDSMQLPVCLTGSGSTSSTSPSGSTDIKNQPNGGDPCSKADNSSVSHPTTFTQLETDSLLVSQPEVGQHYSNVLANKTQDEFLQKQIQLFKEKKRQLAQLQMQIQEQLYKGSDPGLVLLDHEVDNGGLAQNKTSEQTENRNKCSGSEDILTEQVRLDNQHFSRNLNICNQDFKYTGDSSTQGINVCRQVNLDLNSNVTSTENTNKNSLTESIKETQSSLYTHSSGTVSGTQKETQVFCTPTQQKLEFGLEDDITPYILKTKSHPKETVGNGASDKREQDFDEVQSSVRSSEAKKTEPVSVPLWTPLAMKTVAKQQTVDNVSEEKPSAETAASFKYTGVETVNSETKPKTDIFAKSEIDTSVISCENSVNRSGLVPKTSISKYETESDSLTEQCPKTPPNKKSAFRSVGSTSLTPVVGSLSLRANTETKRETGRMHPTELLHNSVLRAANERYLEALLDDEVALFMCRLAPGSAGGKGRDFCHDPVAKILLRGDDMHFIPIEMSQTQLSSVHIEGSAFSKYAIRAT
ncbi:uncharacterized protein LOC123531188 [Mercenaria mercenaria]|uniref:uncharacterized protein LOC123531188 n=1 Tax=Mercenaria mercenaria TaxID=6596 RepID=UPI00234F4728|nr:uncharacterized protein LOC123531188 [Mercenaria mercenaria]XP_053373885.1 uncharacterized protein LOC123531188 [Mercenaria mercenaria]